MDRATFRLEPRLPGVHQNAHSVTGITRINDMLPKLWGQREIPGRPPMKTLLACIAFALAMAFTSQAFATDLPDCPKGAWKQEHYVCGDIQANS